MFIPNENRYEKMQYRRLGRSGLKLPVLSLGLWLNFGAINDYEACKEIILESFNHGITHFDLANNYGPPPGSAELLFGRVLKEALMPYRDQLIISTKAGYKMWEGPYGDFGSRKYLMSSINQSLERLGIPYVDIFYHHRYDPHTDLKETMTALRDIVLQGKALYVGLSNYNSEQLKKAYELLDSMHVPYIITQPSYSMLNRWLEKDGLLDTQEMLGAGTICFSVLSQGKLSNKYIDGIPEDSRAKKEYITFFTEKDIDETLRTKLIQLNEVAKNRNQTISQMALAWALRDQRMTSALISVSKISQLYENLKTLENLDFSKDEIDQIESILK